MIKMAELAPNFIFEDDEYYISPPKDEKYERHFDDYSRNIEEC